MACCGKSGKKVKAEGNYYESATGKGTIVELNYVNTQTGSIAYEANLKIDSVKATNLFRMIYEKKENKYRKEANRLLYPCFPEGSEYGLCENLCVTKNAPTLTVDKKGNIIPIPKPRKEKEKPKEETPEKD